MSRIRFDCQCGQEVALDEDWVTTFTIEEKVLHDAPVPTLLKVVREVHSVKGTCTYCHQTYAHTMSDKIKNSYERIREESPA